MEEIIVAHHLGDKIAIIGSRGAGKTTLALQLGKMLKIPVFHLERFFWLPGWREKSGEVRIKILKELIQNKQWIIEGTYLRSSPPRLDAADTIIFLDMSTWLCLKRVLYRRFVDRRPRPDLPDGCSVNLNFRCILKVLFFRIKHHKELSQKMHSYKSSKNVIWLRSPEEVENFLLKQWHEVNDKKNAILWAPLLQ